jgi:glycerol-3-phosphate O-acyltransferase
METLTSAFKDLIKEAVVRSTAEEKITEENVFQAGNSKIVPLLDKMVETLTLPGSGIRGMENIRHLFSLLKEGRPCLLLLEHYSNLDYSLFHYFLRKEEGGSSIADTLVAIAGKKMNEDSPVVAAFTSAYTRLVIYPSRSLQSLDPEKDREEIRRSAIINRSATRTLIRIKENGSLVLVFPSGTRYRPGDPCTKQGVREIDSYIRLFDYMCPVAINGEVLHVTPGDMMEDSVSQDLVLLTAAPVMKCDDFREQVRAQAEADGLEDKKQAVVDAVMKLLDELHYKAEVERQKMLK